ncbi:hypothetical protein [Azospirillum sp. sgz301742]
MRAHSWWPLAAASGALLFWMGVHYLAGVQPLSEGGLWDADAYLWLLKVRQFLDRGDWYAAPLTALNAPSGLDLHWTRPFELILAAGTWVGSRLTGDTQGALWAWGVLVSPALGLVAVAVLHWGTRPVLPGWAFALGALPWTFHRGVIAAFSPGRPDHHGLQFLLTATVLALLLRHAVARRPATAWGAGAVAALAVWVSPEGLLTFGFGSLVLAVMALRGGAPFGDLTRSLSGFAATILLALAVERPPADWLLAEQDRLSVVHAALAVIAWTTGLALAAVDRRLAPRLTGRLALMVAAGLAAAGAMVLVFPDFFRGPLAGMSDLMREVQFDRVAENRSLIPRDAQSLFGFLTELGQIALAAAVTLWRLRTAGGPLRDAHMVNGVGLLIFAPYGALMLRNAIFAQIFFLLPLCDVAVLATAAVLRRREQGLRPFWPAAAAGVAVLAPILGAAVILAGRIGGVHIAAYDRCPYERLMPTIAALRPSLPAGATVMTSLDDGPEIAWWTGLPTIAGNFHRNEAGVLDALLFMGSEAPDLQALGVAEQRRVGLALYCLRPDESNGPGFLISRLRRRAPPPWLAPVALPPDLAGRFILYRKLPVRRAPVPG